MTFPSALPQTALRWAAAIALAATMAAPALAQVTPRPNAPASFADLVEAVSPSVVNISTSQNVQAPGGRSLQDILPNLPPGSPFEEFFRDFFDQQRPQQGQPPGNGQSRPMQRVNSLGSGFIIDASGVIVTNNHVIADADEIKIILIDGAELPATVVGRDPRTDIAVLRVDPKGRTLKAAQWGNSDQARVGDWVVAIGNPLGFGGTVTAGIVSARGRNIGAGPYDDFIQTDAPINKGNSGGPLFNMSGQVIGVNTAIISPTGASIGIGFSVPSALARNVVDQILEFGKPRRGWLGVVIQPVTPEMVQPLGLEGPRGALVADVTQGGPADGRLQPGDVILQFDGRPVPSNEALPRMVAETAIGKRVPVVVMRKGQRETLNITLGELPEPEQLQARQGQPGEQNRGGQAQAGAAIEKLGLKLAPISAEARRRYNLPANQEGLLVTEVTPNGPAAQRGLRVGDVVLEINQTRVTTVDAAQQKVRQLERENASTALLLVMRNGERRFEPLPMR